MNGEINRITTYGGCLNAQTLTGQQNKRKSEFSPEVKSSKSKSFKHLTQVKTDIDHPVICKHVKTLVKEMCALIRVNNRGLMYHLESERRKQIHIRQISMYVCHVVLGYSLTEIGHIFCRDRTTVSHACKVIEDLRDQKLYDEFLSSIERIVSGMFCNKQIH